MSVIVKICGLATEAGLDAALACGADMAGFVFFDKSPRHVSLELAVNLGRRAATRTCKVLVTVDAGDALLAAAIKALDPGLLQLHGSETPERVAAIRARFGLPVMKAIGIFEETDLALVPVFDAVADFLLFDAKPPRATGRPGGSGTRFDWSLLGVIETRKPWLLAGGLEAGNVADALAQTRAPGVDVSSGVENTPGVKDANKIAAFIAAVRGPPKGLVRPRGPVNSSSNLKRVKGDAVPSALNSFRTGPDETGHFGIFGGRFVAETLMPLILDLEKHYNAAKTDPAFNAELDNLLAHYAGRPSPLYYAERMTFYVRQKAAASGKRGGAKIYFKREELNHTGAHKINNVLGQILLARRMGKTRIIAETGAGQHGVATATACARFGLDCVVYMGSVDVERQKPNVFRMNLLGANVVPVESGARTLKDAMNEALRDWVTNVENTFYCIGTVAGPHPYPAMVRDFQCVIGEETRAQMQAAEGRLPDSLFACIGGGSNAIGLFHPFLDDPAVEIYGVEAAGFGLGKKHAASLAGGRPGVLHGNRTYLLMNADGQIEEGHSISAGLDYPGIGPEHSWLKETGRVTYLSATDAEALAAFQLCAKLEGIIPALEPAHALAKVVELAPQKSEDHLLVVNISGRGDKDIFTVADHLGGMVPVSKPV